MIMPARWYAGGKGLDDFRDSLLSDDRLRLLVDYFDATDCFPNIDLSGGVCYFLWKRDDKGKCIVRNIKGRKIVSKERYLSEFKYFVRFNEATSIIEKVNKKEEHNFMPLVSPRKPFGIETNIGVKNYSTDNSVFIYAYPQNGFIDRKFISSNEKWLKYYKVFISYAYGERGDFPYFVLGKPFIGAPQEVCSETYLAIGPFKDKEMCINVISYIKTKFFRFLVLLRKNTQHATSKVYGFVPLQDFSHPWSDSDLYAKYNLSNDEIAFIESMIKPME